MNTYFCVYFDVLGQLAVLLRSLSKACKDQLDKKLKNSSPISPSDALEVSPLLSGILIIGRIAWLLKIRGRFIEEALVQFKSRASSSSLSNASDPIGGFSISSADMSSEEQLRSAFEIADTDGDGIVTNAEAVEAIQVRLSSPPGVCHYRLV